MNKNFSIESLGNLLIGLFGIFPVLPLKMKGLPVVLFALMAVMLFLRERRIIFSKKNRAAIIHFISLSAVFFVYLFSGLITENIPHFFIKLETGLSLIIIPLSFLLIPSNFSHKLSNQLFEKTFIYSTLCFVSCFLIYLFFYQNDSYPEGIQDVNFIRYAIDNMPLIGAHPIYASFYAGLSIFFVIRNNSSIRIEVVVFLFTIFFIFILLLASKMIIISLSFLLIILILNRIKDNRIRVLIGVGIISFGFLTIVSIPFLNQRFYDLFETSTSTEINEYSSTNIRKGIYSCSLPLVSQSFLIGYGLGDVQDELNACYKGKSDFLYRLKFNTHNQYISLLMSFGVLGLVVFLYSLYYVIFYSILSKDQIFMLIILFFAINFLTENILERQLGVIMYSFIMSFYSRHRVSKMELL